MTSNRGRFITVEGQDGAGKTTNLEFIRSILKGHGIPVVETREPGGTELGEQIRDLVLHSADIDIAPASELLLIFASRAQHIQHLIRPALEQGEWVLCDRFTDATYAYQGGGRGMPWEDICALENLVQKTLRPDLTLLFDVDVETGRRRAAQRAPADRFETEGESFKQAVRATYLKLAHASPERIKVIAANQPLDAVQRQVARVLEGFISACGVQE